MDEKEHQKVRKIMMMISTNLNQSGNRTTLLR